jgi:hypothetical protein
MSLMDGMMEWNGNEMLTAVNESGHARLVRSSKHSIALALPWQAQRTQPRARQHSATQLEG